MAESGITQSIAANFGGIDQVLGVYLVAGDNGAISVFTVISDDEEAVYDQVYEKERLLIRQFTHVHFDFNVIARRGRSIREMFGDRAPAWERAQLNLCPDAISI